MVIGAMSFSPTVLMTVADLSVMEAEVMVDETDIRNLTLGQEAEVEVDALEGLEIEGEVTEIGASAIVRGTDGTQAQAQLGANTGNQPKDFKVKIVLEDPPANLRPGPQRQRRHHHRDPREVSSRCRSRRWWCARSTTRARSSRPGCGRDGEDGAASGGARKRGEEKDGVFVVQDEKAIFTPVKTGIMGDTEIEILEGLEEGQEIVTGSYRTLRQLENEARIKVEKKKEEQDREHRGTGHLQRPDHPRRGPLAHLRDGRRGDPRPAGRDLRDREGRVRGGHGALGLRQVHADEPHRLPRHAHAAAPTSCAARSSRRWTTTSWPPSATARSASSSRPSTCCRGRPRSTTSSCPSSTPGSPGRSGSRRPSRPSRWSTSATGSPTSPTSSPAASASAWRWPGPWS